MSKPRYEQVGVAMTCRSFAEYKRMFALEESQLGEGRILDIAGGASSFTAEASSRGFRAQAADPLYDMGREAIFEHGRAEIETSTAKLEKLQEHFDWSYYGDPVSHKEGRIASLNAFIADYSAPDAGERYKSGRLPQLPFDDGQFRLVLCSHFLFLYHEQFDYSFHRDAVREMLRVCSPGGEIRIYPVFTLKWDRYPHMDQLMNDLKELGAEAAFIPSGLPFIPGSNELLLIVKK
ncbi:methyltransferase domain-containing protein [Paenibacillus hamazuiensis]|uniref:methyltransferase domain-containing protein n=1 Tax=Paenibacillus hamazuiensis TaxID=2936508 RepID=UPI00200F8632|nr:methyltransferase domain-containing protein [Paenibacillus hamazuiensis]